MTVKLTKKPRPKQRKTGKLGAMLTQMVAKKKRKRACLTCRAILKFCFASFPKDDFHLTEQVETIADQCCDVCLRLSFDEKLRNLEGSRKLTLSKTRMDHRIIISGTIRSDIDRLHTKDLGLVANTRGKHARSEGIILDPNWINIDNIRSWMSKCLTSHGPNCAITKPNNSSFHARPSWLIDVKRMCITPATRSMQYFAISYVWGQTKSLRLISANLNKLQKDGALSTSKRFHRLPKTIRDAIELVRLLGERYLWVDSVCIIQDDDYNLHCELNSMASIYANAIATIVAAQAADANAGLHGIRNVSKPRKLIQRIHELAKGYQVIELQTKFYQGSPWRERAWTYQEEAFSARMIVFDGDTVRWECSETWHEDRKLPEEVTGSAASVLGWNRRYFRHVPWPDLSEYAKWVNNYNIRTLTYPEDNLRAFAGVTAAFSAGFEGGFICGLPELFFDIALLWRPHTVMYQRQPLTSSERYPNPLPSWSWAGWFGEIDSFCWSCDYLKSSNSSHRVVSRIQWYCSETITSLRRELQSNKIIRQLRQNARKSHLILPPGWSRYVHRPRPKSDLDPSNRKDMDYLRQYYHGAFDKDNWVYYTHDSDPSTHFWYPIPIRAPESPMELKTLEPYLFCRTQMACLYLGNMAGYHENTTILRTTSGTWAGVMHLNSKKEHPGPSHDCVPCEVILISEGLALNEAYELMVIPEWNDPERPNDSILYEFINVLWIEWDAGVAYRKAVGRVLKSIWEELELEWIDVTLG